MITQIRIKIKGIHISILLEICIKSIYDMRYYSYTIMLI